MRNSQDMDPDPGEEKVRIRTGLQGECSLPTYLCFVIRFAMVEYMLHHIVAVLVLQQLLSVRVDLVQDA